LGVVNELDPLHDGFSNETKIHHLPTQNDEKRPNQFTHIPHLIPLALVGDVAMLPWQSGLRLDHSRGRQSNQEWRTAVVTPELGRPIKAVFYGQTDGSEDH
jgi:hypothetical protein